MTLPDDIQILPGHTSDPIAFNEEPITGSLATVRARVEALRLPEDEFVRSITSHLPPPPPNHAEIVAHNSSGAVYEGDPADLEAGANRCAIT